MIVIGSKWSLRWKWRHRIEVYIVALEPDYVVCEALHRCGFACEILHTKSLSLDGKAWYSYRDFVELFQPMAVDAIPLGP